MPLCCLHNVFLVFPSLFMLLSRPQVLPHPCRLLCLPALPRRVPYWGIAAELWGLLQQPDAVVYVCGDAKAMAKDVHRALCKVAEKEGKMSSIAAENWVKRLGDSGRYHKDVW